MRGVIFLLFALLLPGWNPVVPSDFPDPSVIRVGKDYWATATSGNRRPVYSILHSTDLKHWEKAGAVFDQPPDWVARDFWAPEIAEWRGRIFVYYTARKKNGPLCVAVATAEKPQGPYTDHGPLVCQEAGSIDAAPATDEKGRRWLIWKEDGNSRRQPTPLWAQRLDDDGVQLTGEPVKLFQNDKPWEGGVVEGPYVLRHGRWFYLFYSGNGCCGQGCNYALGVARSRNLLGPWEKNPANPILPANDAWKCPGHGSIVETPDHKFFLLYHAYKPGAFNAGRQGMLDEVTFGRDGWPVINGGRGPS
jgi:xylan 1,4-beta-xylosidase